MDRRQARRLVQGLAWGRIAFGGCLAAFPATAGGALVGSEESRRTGSKAFARGLGARDVALGAGALLALRHDAPVRGWVEAGGLADATDVVSVVLAFPRLPRTLRWMVLAVVLTAAAAASLLAPGVDEAEKGARGA